MNISTRLLFAAVAMLLAFPANAGEGPSASQWSIGPVIKGRNYSVNMPSTLDEARDGPSFEFPFATKESGHVHYVTAPVRSLQNARGITMTYRIDAARGVRFVAQESPQQTATMSLYFQRAGDRWTAKQPRHRWYAPTARAIPLTPGTHTVSISFEEPWIAMMGGDSHSHPYDFEAALSEASRVGFVFGSEGGRGHGVYATGPARFTVLDFRID